jgi:hypothetical protein
LNAISDLLRETSNPVHKETILDELTIMDTKLKNTQKSKRDKKLNFLFQKTPT